MREGYIICIERVMKARISSADYIKKQCWSRDHAYQP